MNRIQAFERLPEELQDQLLASMECLERLHHERSRSGDADTTPAGAAPLENQREGE